MAFSLRYILKKQALLKVVMRRLLSRSSSIFSRSFFVLFLYRNPLMVSFWSARARSPAAPYQGPVPSLTSLRPGHPALAATCLEADPPALAGAGSTADSTPGGTLGPHMFSGDPQPSDPACTTAYIPDMASCNKSDNAGFCLPAKACGPITISTRNQPRHPRR